jgi:hypothetical protein
MLHHFHPKIGTNPPLRTLTFDRKNYSKNPHHNPHINKRECTSSKGSAQDKDTGKTEQEKTDQLQLLFLLLQTCALFLVFWVRVCEKMSQDVLYLYQSVQ